MSTRRILASTAIRSDYDLLSKLYRNLNDDSSIDFGLIVSGAHLSTGYGNSVSEIQSDGLKIVAKIDCLLDSDRRSSRLKSSSIFLLEAIGVVEAWAPDLIIYSGDREDALMMATIGAYLGIPTAHFFGGDHSTDGNVDNPVRHAISKLSSFHFVAHKDHVRRLRAMGEEEQRIFSVGSPSLDKFNDEEMIPKDQFLKEFGRASWKDFALVIFHPILGEELSAGDQFRSLMESVKELKMPAFVSHPNVDAGNKAILEVIESYREDQGFYFIKNVPRRLFINLMRHAKVMIGNSSAGILEAPMVRLGVLNVGSRQRGRLSCGNVIFVGTQKSEILAGLDTLLSDAFQSSLSKVESEYGDGKSVEKIAEILKSMSLSPRFIRKTFDPIEASGTEPT